MKCKACGHPRVDEIDRRVIEGETCASLSKEYGLTPTILKNHIDKHVPAKLQLVLGDRSIARAKTLVERLENLQQRNEFALKQIIPCPSLDLDPNDPSRTEADLPIVDWTTINLNGIASIIKSQVLALELYGRATGELQMNQSNGRQEGVKLVLMLPAKVDPGGAPTNLLEYRAEQDQVETQTRDTIQHCIETSCTSE